MGITSAHLGATGPYLLKPQWRTPNLWLEESTSFARGPSPVWEIISLRVRRRSSRGGASGSTSSILATGSVHGQSHVCVTSLLAPRCPARPLSLCALLKSGITLRDTWSRRQAGAMRPVRRVPLLRYLIPSTYLKWTQHARFLSLAFSPRPQHVQSFHLAPLLVPGRCAAPQNPRPLKALFASSCRQNAGTRTERKAKGGMPYQ